MNGPKEILRILVVDDSAISRKLAEYSLAEKPYDVMFAENGHEGLKLVESWHPDIVFTDWVMPGLSGLELCQAIRKKLKCMDTYLVLLTSNSGESNRSQGIAAGADGYLTKPIRSEELFAQIRAARGVLKARREVLAK